MIVEKGKGEMNTKLSLRTECEESVTQFELEINYGEMLVLQRLLDVRSYPSGSDKSPVLTALHDWLARSREQEDRRGGSD